MQQGSIDLIILLIIFLALQAFWIYPILKKNRDFKKKTTNLREEIETLERLFKK
tara:strand:+ start:205 stop:366 length:162 start_codon:yes stop_codon:yes gene_type:complete